METSTNHTNRIPVIIHADCAYCFIDNHFGNLIANIYFNSTKNFGAPIFFFFFFFIYFIFII